MSRLLLRLDRLEAAADEARPSKQPWPGHKPSRVGVCWTSHDQRIDAATLGQGEYIAADVLLEPDASLSNKRDGGATEELRFFWAGAVTITERVTSDSRDLGQVTEEGIPVGRVVAICGDRVDWELFP